jgi:hypothetical protein
MLIIEEWSVIPILSELGFPGGATPVIFKNRSAAINGLTLAPSPRGSQVRT